MRRHAYDPGLSGSQGWSSRPAEEIPMPALTFEEALERLAFHDGSDGRIDDARWESGFHWHTTAPEAREDLQICLDVVSEHLCAANRLDRRLIDHLWGICHYGHSWIHGVADPALRAELTRWLDDYEWRIVMMIEREADPAATPEHGESEHGFHHRPWSPDDPDHLARLLDTAREPLRRADTLDRAMIAELWTASHFGRVTTEELLAGPERASQQDSLLEFTDRIAMLLHTGSDLD